MSTEAAAAVVAGSASAASASRKSLIASLHAQRRGQMRHEHGVALALLAVCASAASLKLPRNETATRAQIPHADLHASNEPAVVPQCWIGLRSPLARQTLSGGCCTSTHLNTERFAHLPLLQSSSALQS